MSNRNIYMPRVDPMPPEQLAQIFTLAHATSLGQHTVPVSRQRCLVMLSPGRLMLQFYVPAPNTVAVTAEEAMKDILYWRFLQNALLPSALRRIYNLPRYIRCMPRCLFLTSSSGWPISVIASYFLKEIRWLSRLEYQVLICCSSIVQ